ncbi:MAG: hypothetical protein WAS73_07480 [Defluviicoccus sp.]
MKAEMEALNERIDELRESISDTIGDMKEIIEYLSEHREELKANEIRDAVKSYLIRALRKIATTGLEEGTPEKATENTKKMLLHDANELGDVIERKVWEQLGTFDSDLRPAPMPSHGSLKRPAHVCGAKCTTQDGTCHRLTTDEYCYQHADAASKEGMRRLAGKWQMSGRQADLERSHWEAALTLEATGRCSWKETRGANVGARRSGKWTWGKDVFQMFYRAPKAGRVEWKAVNVKPTTRSMGGSYSTPQVDLKGPGWGGTWSANRATS